MPKSLARSRSRKQSVWSAVAVDDHDVMSSAGAEGGFVLLEEMDVAGMTDEAMFEQLGAMQDSVNATAGSTGGGSDADGDGTPASVVRYPRWSAVTVADDDVMAGDEGGFVELEEMDAPEGMDDEAILARFGTLENKESQERDNGGAAARSEVAVAEEEEEEEEEEEDAKEEEEEEEEEDVPSPFVDDAVSSRATESKSRASRLATHEGFRALLTACGCEKETDARALAKEACTSDWASSCGLDPFVSGALVHGCGFRAPTAIQRATMPHTVRGRQDLIGASQTGSGKTLAYVLPIAHRLVNEHGAESRLTHRGARYTPLRALAMCPTRELAAQVGDHARAVLDRLGFGSVVLVGGVAIPKQQRQLARRPSFVVATPGRLWELMGLCSPPGSGGGGSRTSGNEEGPLAARRQAAGLAHLGDLSGLIALVIDEADRMMERGHFAELAEIATRVAKRRQWAQLAAEERGEDPPDMPHLQTFVFSATLMLPPGVRGKLESKRGKKQGANVLKSLRGASTTKGSLSSLLKMLTFHDDRLQIVDLTRGGASTVGTAMGSVAENGDTDRGGALPSAADAPAASVASKVTECALFASEEDKDVYLYNVLLSTSGRTMIFCNAVSAVRRLKSILVDHLRLEGYSLFGEQQQKARFKACERFQASEGGIIVCTDVAARGLDLKDVALVVHYHVPRDVETYVHRSGRTGRGGLHGGEGLSLSLVAPSENTRFRRLRRAMTPGNSDESALTLPEFPMDLARLATCRRRLAVASKLDAAKSKRKRGRASEAWVERNSSEIEIEADDESKGDKEVSARSPEELRWEAELSRLLGVVTTSNAGMGKDAGGASSKSAKRKRSALASEMAERLATGKTLGKKARRRQESARMTAKNDERTGPRGMTVITPEMFRASTSSASASDVNGTHAVSSLARSEHLPRPLDVFRRANTAL